MNLELMIKKSAFSLLETSLILVIVVLVVTGVGAIKYEIDLNDRDSAIKISCKLIKKSYSGSTIEYNAAPIVGVGANGQIAGGVGLTTSGNSEQFITVFNCGTNGNLVSNKKSIFTKSKSKNTLLVNFLEDDYKIIEVVND